MIFQPYCGRLGLRFSTASIPSGPDQKNKSTIVDTEFLHDRSSAKVCFSLAIHEVAGLTAATSRLSTDSPRVLAPLLAQLDRASGFEPEGRGFESLGAGQDRGSQFRDAKFEPEVASRVWLPCAMTLVITSLMTSIRGATAF